MTGVGRGLAYGVVALGALFGLGAAAAAEGGVPAPSGRNAVIAVELRNMRIEKAGEVYRFVHDRAFVEQAGVGAVITQGQVCFSSGICQGKAVEYRVEPHGVYVITDAVLEPLGPEEQFAYTYQGEDDNGHPVLVIFRVSVKGDKYEMSP